jgi:amino acid transporter
MIRAADEPLPRQLSALALWLIAVNGTIGAGIFGTPARAAELTGAYSPLLFALCGLCMAPIVLSFAEIARYFRGTGGPILYTNVAFGPLAGFQVGWTYWVARATAFAANVNLAVDTLGRFWAPVAQGAVRVALLIAVCGALTWINVRGARQAMRSVGVLTVLKLAPLALLVVGGLVALDPARLSLADAPVPPLADFGAAAVLLIYAYVGWESAAVPAGEARNPERDLPRALCWGLAVVTLFYVLVQTVAVATLPGIASSKSPVVDVAGVLLGPTGAVILTAGVVASVGGNVASAMFSTPRVTYALSREGHLPAWLGAVHPRFGTPTPSIVFFGAVVCVLAVAGSFGALAAASALTRLLVYLACILAIPRLRRLVGGGADRVRSRGDVVVPVAGALVCVGLLTQVSGAAVLLTAELIAVGLVLYAVARLRRRRA